MSDADETEADVARQLAGLFDVDEYRRKREERKEARKALKEPETIDEIFDRFEEEMNAASAISGCMEWGSCQYDSAKAVYDWALRLMRHPQTGLEMFEKVMGITHGTVMSKEEVIIMLRGICLDAEANMNDEDAEDEPSEVPDPFTIESYFTYTREHSWDLWSAAFYPFADFKCEQAVNTRNDHLPILNAMAAGENFDTGLSCAYLTFLFGVSEDNFKGYDT